MNFHWKFSLKVYGATEGLLGSALWIKCAAL